MRSPPAVRSKGDLMQGELTIRRLLLKMKEIKASDLHIKTGAPPIMRVASELHLVNVPALDLHGTEKLLTPLIPEHLRDMLRDEGGIDFSHHEGEEHAERFRCSVFSAGGALHAAIRRVNPSIPSFDDLHLPPVYKKIEPAEDRRLDA